MPCMKEYWFMRAVRRKNTIYANSPRITGVTGIKDSDYINLAGK